MATPTATASLTTATAVGPGTTVDFTTTVAHVSMMLISNGTINGGVVAVEASHDGTNWVKLDGFTPLTGLNQAYHGHASAFRYWRANILAEISGGGSVSATFAEGS